MSKEIIKDLPQLVEASIISEDTANKIREFYLEKGGKSQNRLFIVFGILGATLVGLGLILIIAHNWDDLSRPAKTFFAFLPLVLGQLFCGFTILKKADSTAWKESSTAFLFLSVGGCISMISQIYNISDDLSKFILVWMLLCFPLIYVMKSSAASLLYIVGISYYAGEIGYWSYPHSGNYLYWGLLALAIPHYYFLYRNKKESNFTLFHHWFIPLSVIFALGTIPRQHDGFLNIAYMSLFGLFYIMGEMKYFKESKWKSNGYTVCGSLGIISLLLILSYDGIWNRISAHSYYFSDVFSSSEFYAAVFFSVSAFVLLYTKNKKGVLGEVDVMEMIFLLFIIVFITGCWFPVFSTLLINLIVLGLGISAIRRGSKMDHLAVLNYGLLIIMALATCRFFDDHITYFVRGSLFVLAGAGFFITNYRMLKKRKTDES